MLADKREKKKKTKDNTTEYKYNTKEPQLFLC